MVKFVMILFKICKMSTDWSNLFLWKIDKRWRSGRVPYCSDGEQAAMEKVAKNVLSCMIVEIVEKRKTTNYNFYRGSVLVKDKSKVEELYCNQDDIGDNLTGLKEGQFCMLTNVTINPQNIKTTVKTKVCLAEMFILSILGIG